MAESSRKVDNSMASSFGTACSVVGEEGGRGKGGGVTLWGGGLGESYTYIYTYIYIYRERERERERSRLGREAEEAEGAESNSIIYIYIQSCHALGGWLRRLEGAEGNRNRACNAFTSIYICYATN